MVFSWGLHLSVLIRSKVAGVGRCLQPRSALSFFFLSFFQTSCRTLRQLGLEMMKKNQKNKCHNKGQEVTERGGDEIFHLVRTQLGTKQRKTGKFKTKLNQIQISSLTLNMNAGLNLGPDDQPDQLSSNCG